MNTKSQRKYDEVALFVFLILMSNLKICPKYRYSSIVEAWDETTREEGKIPNHKRITSVGADKYKIIEQDSWFICSTCGEEVTGLDL